MHSEGLFPAGGRKDGVSGGVCGRGESKLYDEKEGVLALGRWYWCCLAPSSTSRGVGCCFCFWLGSPARCTLLSEAKREMERDGTRWNGMGRGVLVRIRDRSIASNAEVERREGGGGRGGGEVRSRRKRMRRVDREKQSEPVHYGEGLRAGY